MANVKNVFIVDDNQMDLDIVKNYLSSGNYNIFSFTDANEALAKMEEISPDLIVLDYIMPTMNGDTFMVKVSERLLHNHNWQVYLVTGKQFDKEEELSMLTLGITHIFDKPLKKDLFLKTVDDFLE